MSAVDIGGVAFAALTQPEPPNKDYRIVGPELLTHDEVLPALLVHGIFLSLSVSTASLLPITQNTALLTEHRAGGHHAWPGLGASR